MKTKRMAPLIAGSLIYLCIGLIYAWSIFVAPIEAEFGWNRTQTSATFTISMIFFCIGGIASGMIQKKKTPRFVILLSAILLAIGFFASSRVETITALFIAYGVFCGFGVGLSYNANISTITKWYPDKTGMVSGILLMCFGCGSMILGTLASRLIEMMGWRTTFLVFAISFAIIIILCSVFIKPPGEDVVLPDKTPKKESAKEEGLEFTAGEMMKRKSFWLFFIWATILSAAGLAIIGHASVCIEDIGATVTIATFATGLISVFNGLGRIVIGYVFDNFGRKFSMVYGNTMMLLAFGILAIAYKAEIIPVFFVGAAFLGLAYGSVPPINSAFANLFYGKKDYALNFSIINSNIIPASLLGPLVAGGIQTSTGSYFTVFLLMLALSFLVFILQFFIKKP